VKILYAWESKDYRSSCPFKKLKTFFKQEVYTGARNKINREQETSHTKDGGGV
jgi:hypothetical protein